MDSRSSFYTALGPHAVPLSNRPAEVAQEFVVNSMMGFGRQGRAAMLSSSSLDDENYRFNRPARPASLRSQPYHDDSSTPSFVTAREYDEPVGATSDPDLFYNTVGGGRDGEERTAMTLPIRPSPAANTKCTTPEAEGFYRASSPYTKWVEARESRSTPVRSPKPIRPLTPYPPTTSRRYATLPIPSAREREYLDSTILASQHPPRRRQNQPLPKPPPPRLPNTYRAETPFSFDRPPTTTPFSSSSARPMSPSHWLYNAPRVGGVQMEVNALQKATEGRGAIHRALWPEEREMVLGEVDVMAGRLVRGVGRVKDEEVKREDQREAMKDEIGEEKIKEKKFGWLKRMWGGRKKKESKEKEEDEILDRAEESSHARPHTSSGSVPPSVHYTAPSARQEQRDFSNDTTVVARSTPTIVTETPSPTQKARQTKTAKRSAHKTKKRRWWQVVSRGRIGYTPKSQEMMRKQTSLVCQKSQRHRVKSTRAVGGSREGPVVMVRREIGPHRIAVEDHFGLRGSENSFRVGQIRDV